MKPKTKIPKPVSLTIRICPEFPKPLDDGRWQFFCALPFFGTNNCRIIADSAEEAKQVLVEYIYNELNNHDDLYNE